MTQQRRWQRFVRGWRLVLIVSVVLLGVSVTCVIAQDEDGAGLVISGKATSHDVGLPIYPGAKPHKDTSNDSDAARLGMWGGGLGFKLAILKMESEDSPAQVAGFYQKALAKYGKVLDCTSGGTNDEGKNNSSGVLTCDDKPEKGEMLFKAGTKEKQHIVAVEPNGKGTTFDLVYVWTKGN